MWRFVPNETQCFLFRYHEEFQVGDSRALSQVWAPRGCTGGTRRKPALTAALTARQDSVCQLPFGTKKEPWGCSEKGPGHKVKNVSFTQLRTPIVSEVLEARILCSAGLSHWASSPGPWSQSRAWAFSTSGLADPGGALLICLCCCVCHVCSGLGYRADPLRHHCSCPDNHQTFGFRS